MVGLFIVYRETILVFSKEEIRRTATLPTDFFFIIFTDSRGRLSLQNSFKILCDRSIEANDYPLFTDSRGRLSLQKKGEFWGLVFYVKHSITVCLNRTITKDFK